MDMYSNMIPWSICFDLSGLEIYRRRSPKRRCYPINGKPYLVLKYKNKNPMSPMQVTVKQPKTSKFCFMKFSYLI